MNRRQRTRLARGVGGALALVAVLTITGAAVAGVARTYPWTGARCAFGAAGGATCANPKDRNDKYDWGLADRKGFHRFDAWGYEYRNCTSYVAWRLWTAGKRDFSGLGDASDWPASARARAAAGVRRDHAAAPGAVAVWVASNHVAYVESTAGGVTISDYNARGTGRYWAPHRVTAYDGRQPDWYIHFP